MSKILGGTAGAQALALLAMPFVSRLYVPADYGVFGTVVAITMIVTIIASFQLHQAIVLPKVGSHAISLFQLACVGVLVGGVLTAIVAYAFWKTTDAEMGGQNLLAMALLAGSAVTAVGIGQASQGLAVREKAFGRIGIAALLRAGVVVAIQIGLGLSNGGVVGLLAGYVAGEIAAFAYLCKFALPAKFMARQGGFRRYYVLAGRYKDFTTFGTAQEAMNSASQGVPVMLFAVYFGPTVAGYYAFAIKILMAPVNMIANAVRQVLSVRFAEHLNKPEGIRQDFRRATVALAIPSVLGALLIMPFSPDLYALLFGPEWREAGEYGKWLLLWCAFGVFNVPSTLSFRILRRQRASFLINAMVLATRAAVLVVGGMYWTPVTTVLMFAMAGIVWNVIVIVVATSFVRYASERI